MPNQYTSELLVAHIFWHDGHNDETQEGMMGIIYKDTGRTCKAD